MPLHQYNERKAPGLWIVGLGTQFPENLLRPEELELFARKHYDAKSGGLRKLLAINRKTGIETRSSVLDLKTGFAAPSEPPTISDIDSHFRDVGVKLAVQACEKALREAGLSPEDITHTVAVTCTNQGNPGYDFLVNERLGLSPNVDRTLLHGVGCAGGLATMRAAAQMALAGTARRRPVRVLAFACELCTLNVRNELAAAEASLPEDVCVAAALFSDAAAAFVLTNDLGRGAAEAVYEVCAFDNAVLPGTKHHMSYLIDPFGFRTVLSKAVPILTTQTVVSMFDRLVTEYAAYTGKMLLVPDNFDWALHPGGDAIIKGVQDLMSLTDEQLGASKKIYRTRGNASSAAVLIVLDELRGMGKGKDDVVAMSFGPGLSIEMAMLRRCRAKPLVDEII
ncbi:hypothetical protein WHR41_02085 [Cladosporium halotolerans]|uniref:Thiolase-like protein n=1 Tax=Cladosporium halotolerans TaxID=1052096 RepID=A0AB34KVQ6_9PEZI